MGGKLEYQLKFAKTNPKNETPNIPFHSHPFSTSFLCGGSRLAVPTAEPQLVVNAIITPDSTIKVNLFKTTEVEQNTDMTVYRADISLYENNTFIAKLNEPQPGVYELDYKPKPLHNYSVEINTPQWGISSSEIYMPDTVVISDAKYKPYQWYDEREMANMATCSFVIQDPPEVENYYELLLWRQDYQRIVNDQWEVIDSFAVFEPVYNVKANNEVIENEGLKDKRPSTLFFSDKLFNGQNYTFTFDCSISLTERGYTDENGVLHIEYYPDGQKLMVQVRSISKEYYQFRRSWTQHLFNQKMQELRDISEIVQYMFATEPVRMYSNINNGLGIFAGYSAQTIELQFVKP